MLKSRHKIQAYVKSLSVSKTDKGLEKGIMKKYVTLKEREKLRAKCERTRKQNCKELLQKYNEEKDPEKKSKLKKLVKKGKKPKRKSVWTISGGLPSLGKKR